MVIEAPLISKVAIQGHVYADPWESLDGRHELSVALLRNLGVYGGWKRDVRFASLR